MAHKQNDGTPLPEMLADPFSDTRISGSTPKDIVARAIQRDARATGVYFDADFAGEMAEAILASLYDEEIQADALSFVFENDVRRVLAA